MDYSRRRILASSASIVSAAGMTAVAGCLGSDDGDSGTAGDTTGSDGSNAADNPFDDPPPSLDPRIRGDGGPLIEVYVDYACPHCQSFKQDVWPELETLVADGDARLVDRDFPIPVDETWSWRLPNLPRSAQAQAGSPDAYWTTADRIWTSLIDGATPDETFVRDLAERADLDADRTWEAVRYERFRSPIETQRQAGIDAGVSGTPTVAVAGDLLDESSVDAITAAVEEASE